MSRSIIFYSNKCSYCSQIMNLMQEFNILGNFVKICIDDRRIKIPKQITKVPTLIVPDCNTPLVDQFVYNWVIKYAPSNNNSSFNDNQNRVQDNNNQNQNSQNQDTQDKDILPFNKMEMTGYSDKFAYLENDTPLDHSYSYLNDNSKSDIKINTPSDDSGNFGNNNNTNNSINNRGMSMDKLLEMRESEVRGLQINQYQPH